MPIGGDGWAQTVLKEFGLPLLLFPAYVVVAVRHPHPVTSLLVIVSTLAFLTPLFVEYPTSDIELTRLFGLSMVSNGLLMGITLDQLLSRPRIRPVVLPIGVAVVALVAISPLTFNLVAFPSSPRAFEPSLYIEPSYPVALSPEYTVAEAARDLVPERTRVLTATPTTVMTLWGRFAPWTVSRGSNSPSEAWQRALQSPELSLLQQMKIDYVYWSPAWAAISGRDPHRLNSDLDRLPYLTRVYEFTDSSGLQYAIYQVQNLAPESANGLWYNESSPVGGAIDHVAGIDP